MYRGKVTNVDAKGVYVQTADFGVIGPCQAVVANYAVGDMVLLSDVGSDAAPDLIVVGQLSDTGSAASIPDGSITSAKIADATIVNADVSASAAIARSKISGLPTSSTDNTVPRFDGVGGALQTSGVTVSDDAEVSARTFQAVGTTSIAAVGYFDAPSSGYSSALRFRTGTSNRWFVGKTSAAESGSNAGSNLQLYAYDDSGSGLGVGIEIVRATRRVTIGAPGSTGGIELGSSGPTITTGTGAPSHTAPNGSIWLRTDGTAATTLYVRAGGAWSALT